MRTGPFTFRFFSLAPRIKSAQTVDEKPKFTHTCAHTHSHHTFKKLWLRIAYTVTRIDLLKGLSSRLRCLFTLSLLILLTLLQRLDVAAGEGDADAVDGDLGLHRSLASVFESLQVENKTSQCQNKTSQCQTPQVFPKAGLLHCFKGRWLIPYYWSQTN